MRCMLQKWQVLRLDEGVVDSAVIEQTLARLGPSDTFALDVAAQNAALVVTVDADGATAVVKVLQIHPSNNLTTANNGNLSAVYPGAAVRVPIARVRGQALAFQIADLCNNNIAASAAYIRKGITVFTSMHLFNFLMLCMHQAGSRIQETRDVCNPNYITEWLLNVIAGDMPLLTDHTLLHKKASTITLHHTAYDLNCAVVVDILHTCTGIATVTTPQASLHSSVIMGSGYMPWRRSAVYIALKAVLHMELVARLGLVEGTILYKTIMLQLLQAVGSTYADQLRRSGNNSIKADLTLQMLQKVALRLIKLSAATSDTGTVSTAISSSCNAVIASVSKWVCDERRLLDTAWLNEVRMRSADTVLSSDKLNYSKDTAHKLTNALPHIELALQPQTNNKKMSIPTVSTAVKFDMTSSTIPSITTFSGVSTDRDRTAALHHIEFWVREYLWSLELTVNRYSVTEVYKLLQKYTETAKQHYSGDAVSNSTMVLTAFTMVCYIDKAVANQYPMLRKHKCGIKISVLPALLLPCRQDMQLQHETESYVTQRDEYASKGCVMDDTSFATAYAQQHQSMIQLLQRIQAKAASDRAAKIIDVEEAKVTLADYKEQARLEKLEAHRLYDAQTDKYGKVPNLAKYSRLCNQAAQMVVDVFEEPLPQDTASQYAVVFELLVPTEIVILRQALLTLARDVCHMSANSLTQHGHWRDHSNLRQYCNRNVSTATSTVKLCSTNKRHKGSHYRAPRLYDTSKADDFLKN
eukprot:4782-Heterococcus_DN1.PRE.1